MFLNKLSNLLVEKTSLQRQRRNIFCPICKGRTIKTIYSYKNICIHRCSYCGTMFREPYNIIPQDKCNECQNRCFDKNKCLDTSYTKSLLALRIKLEKKRMMRIKSHLQNDFSRQSVLEIGAGTGALASLMITQGADYKGVEPSSVFYRELLDNFPYLKEKVTNCCLTCISFKKNYFDLIVIIDVLQFIPYPIEFLNQLKDYLKKDGVLYIELPNEFLLRYRAGVRKMLGLYSGFPIHPGHINLFTKKTLKMVLNEVGFKSYQLYQITVAGDHLRMEMTLKRKLPWLLQISCDFCRFTKLDLFFQQGNIVGVFHRT